METPQRQEICSSSCHNPTPVQLHADARSDGPAMSAHTVLLATRLCVQAARTRTTSNAKTTNLLALWLWCALPSGSGTAPAPADDADEATTASCRCWRTKAALLLWRHWQARSGLKPAHASVIEQFASACRGVVACICCELCQLTSMLITKLCCCCCCCGARTKRWQASWCLDAAPV